MVKTNNPSNSSESSPWFFGRSFFHYWNTHQWSETWLRSQGYNPVAFLTTDIATNEELNFTLQQNDEEEICEDKKVEISEEYLQFAMQTKRHQLERERLRKERTKYEKEQVEYIDIANVNTMNKTNLISSVGSKNVFSVTTRKERMQEIYGDNANIIQTMETAIQLNFDNLCDLHQPKFWPTIPIRTENFVGQDRRSFCK